MPSRFQFLAGYGLPLDARQDFHINDKPARWSSGHPKEWGQEDGSFAIPEFSKEGKENSYSSYCATMSDDAKLLAINSHQKIWIFDVESKELRQELDGKGKLRFRPTYTVTNSQDALSADAPAAYTLVSSVPKKDQLIIWELDKNGRLIDQEEHIDTSEFAAKAICSIATELKTRHEWSKEFIKSSTLHADIESALSRVAADHRRRHNTTIENAHLASYGPSPFSHDGKYLLFHSYNEGTSHRKCTAETLPHVVVWDFESARILFRLGGHNDTIMFSGFSPDDQHIASVSWDGTMRMYSATDGSLQWVTENTNSQCWTGAFTRDSKHIAWTCNNGGDLKVHKVSDGHQVAKFPQTFNSWCRCLDWHPDGQQLALCFDEQAVVWRPFDDDDGGIIAQQFRLKFDKEWRGFNEIGLVEWIDNGNRLVVSISEGSHIVWNSGTNAKELFKRPEGKQVAWTDQGLFHLPSQVPDADSYITVDGDGKVRYWRASVAAESWWEKDQVELPKKEYPETGKYVNIVKHAKPKEYEESCDRDVWTEKGAGLWTAE